MKKDFTAINTDRVYSSIAEATAEVPQEAQQEAAQPEALPDPQPVQQPAAEPPIEEMEADQEQTEALTYQLQRQAAPEEPPVMLPSDPPELDRRSRDIEPTAGQVAMAQAMGRTQGRKGCKAVRINMAFSPELYLYIRTMAKARGQSITAFTNSVFMQNMKDNKDLYEQAKGFIEKFGKGEEITE